MVFDKVKEIIQDQLNPEDPSAITPDANVQDDLGADSLDIVDLVMSLEEEYDVEIPDEAVAELKTVGDIVKYIEEHMEG